MVTHSTLLNSEGRDWRASRLSRSHLPELADFSCGTAPWAQEVSSFLQEDAFDHQAAGLSETILFHNNGQLVGFVALMASSVKTDLPIRPAGKPDVGDGMAYFPSVTIQYMGVDSFHQGGGHGGDILRWTRAEVLSTLIGVRFLTAFVRRENRLGRGFWGKNGFTVLDELSDSLFLAHDLYAS